MHRMTKKLSGIFLLTMLVLLPVLWGSDEASAASTSLTVTKLASDGETVIAERTVDYEWLMDPDNIRVMGDGNTHYYHQGPVFIDDPDEQAEEQLRWNPEEDTNVEDKDMGAVMGTNVEDLCELVGGMSRGETLQIKASDGLKKMFDYENVYGYSSKEGPMVVCWYKDGMYPDTGYSDGMRLVWFADDSTNPWGINVFGNWDWHEAADSEYWYYYRSGGESYPTTTGLSIQNVAYLTIYSNEDPPKEPEADFKADKTSGYAPLSVKFTDKSANSPSEYEWDFDNDGKVDSTDQNPSFKYSEPGVYTVCLTAANSIGSDEMVKADYITVREKPSTKTLFNGTVDLTSGKTINVTAYNSNSKYEVSETTTLGALAAAADEKNFDYEVTDKKYSQSGVLLLDEIESYISDDPGDWYVYINDVYKDSYNKKSHALNLLELKDGDEVDFYYAEDINDPDDIDDVEYWASAAIKIAVSISEAASKPVAAFTAAPVNGTEPLTVSFINQSTGTGPLTYEWDFDNDGLADSTDRNPEYIYKTAGTYTVKLTVTNEAGSDEEIKTGYITAKASDIAALYDIAGHWAQGSIESLLASGAVSGYPDNSFRPDATITRGEFVTILVKAFKLEPGTGKLFTDTTGHWAKDYISAAAALGIVNGYDVNCFGPDDLITREQMAVMIIKALDIGLIPGDPAFSDQTSISDWAKSSVKTAGEEGILSGYPDNTFRPQGNATRAEAVMVIAKALE
ncbi:MAG TPA: S-layer homology domain-containing protein [Syntrophomonadaceae bacterium]|nr:S-layer homology domain-containing protein [Syntrophomonadaceae bacterium]HPR94304.1 S-layer homology domain-containing protein [Syntrophomonadaceae bacterium]